MNFPVHKYSIQNGLPRFEGDYYPFGSVMQTRSYSSGAYPFGFNGKELDNENNCWDYGFRIYNANLGKFLSTDPLFQSYCWYTPYQFAGNMPLAAIDLDGLEEFIVNQYKKYGILYITTVSYVFVKDRVVQNSDGKFIYKVYDYSAQWQTRAKDLDLKKDSPLTEVDKLKDPIAKQMIKDVKDKSSEPTSESTGFAGQHLEFPHTSAVVKFDTDGTTVETLSQSVKTEMEYAAVQLLQTPEVGLSIDGYADAQGVKGKTGLAKQQGLDHNIDLSQKRANAMKQYVGDFLTSKSVDPIKIAEVLGRITATGKGTRESPDDAANGANSKNRVAEVNLTASDGGKITDSVMNKISVKYGVGPSN